MEFIQLVVIAVSLISDFSNAKDVYGPVSIVGGTDAEQHAFPYQISMKYSGSDHYCGGSLVRAANGEIVVVTAAHCMDKNNPSAYTIVAGRHSIGTTNSNQQEVGVRKIVVHPDYDDDTYSNDVAIMYLDKAIETADGPNDPIQTIKLTDKPSVYFFNQQCYITGWGTTQFGGDIPDILQVAKVDFFPDSKCTKDYGSAYVKKTMLCAGKEEGGIDSCQGDSGGPFACLDKDTNKLVLNGITSWGEGCALETHPGVYADVYMLRNWLDERLGF